MPGFSTGCAADFVVNSHSAYCVVALRCAQYPRVRLLCLCCVVVALSCSTCPGPLPPACSSCGRSRAAAADSGSFPSCCATCTPFGRSPPVAGSQQRRAAKASRVQQQHQQRQRHATGRMCKQEGSDDGHKIHFGSGRFPQTHGCKRAETFLIVSYSRACQCLEKLESEESHTRTLWITSVSPFVNRILFTNPVFHSFVFFALLICGAQPQKEE